MIDDDDKPEAAAVWAGSASLLLLMLIIFLMAGCSNHFKDGYQFGDITKTVIDARNLYCNATNDEQRQAAKAKLEGMGIDTGEESVCALTIVKLIEKASE